MNIDDFDFDLPDELIARYPTEQRTGSRLLSLGRESGQVGDYAFADIEHLLQPGDCLVVNNSKVIRAQLEGKKDSGGALACLIERALDHETLTAHIKANKSPKPGSRLIFAGGLEMEVLEKEASGLFHCRYTGVEDLYRYLDLHGQVPLPPYFGREAEEEDVKRYQTVYAKYQGSVAAPTAGLHFDDALLARLEGKGVTRAELTLHVGAGTFQPVRHGDISNHHMHSERIELSQQAVDLINMTKENGGRVIAVGTTSVRVLESVWRSQGKLVPFIGETDIFIKPGDTFGVVEGLLTNFHLPKSTLVMLVSAFAGQDAILRAYQHAVREGYRFFSYGDAMLIV